jgi:hypothetical protein
MEKMSLEDFRSKVGSRIFSAIFTKADGTERKIVARLGVTKHLKGGELAYDAAARNNLIVFDMVKKAYRTIPFDRLHNIKFDGESYDA